MDQDFSSKIERLKDMLNDENVSDNLKNVINMMSNNTISNQTENNDSNGNTKSGSSNIDAQTLAIISKVKTILDKKNSISDPRVNLLNAIKPYLNNKRQERIENFSKILNFALISQILNDEDN